MTATAITGTNFHHQVPPQEPLNTQRKGATEATIKANREFASRISLKANSNSDDVHRGFIAELPREVIKKGIDVVWDPGLYSFIKQGAEAPDTVNPSLWHHAQRLAVTGLFKVCERIYQVRGYDISNITFIEGDSGVIVMDPLISAEVAEASLKLYYSHRPQKPVVAVIYTHNHLDHYGGVKGGRF